MGYIHPAKNFQVQSSGSGDMSPNDLARGPPETVNVICVRCLSFNIFSQLHF